MAVANNQVATKMGLILLGNTGAGKSFLVNCILNRNRFASRFSPSSVTKTTQYEEIEIGSLYAVIFDIPGLIEADQAAIDRNKREIYRAFEIEPNSIIGFVFNVCGSGRLRDEDVVAFNAIREAYSFNLDSLLLIVNGVSNECPDDYHGEMTLQLISLLNIANPNVCFLNQVSKSEREMQELAQHLIFALQKRKAANHAKINDIKLKADEVKRLTDEVANQKSKFADQISNLQAEVKAQQEMYEKSKRQMEQTIQQNQSWYEQCRQLMETRLNDQMQQGDYLKQELDAKKEEFAYQRTQLDARIDQLIAKSHQCNHSNDSGGFCILL